MVFDPSKIDLGSLSQLSPVEDTASLEITVRDAMRTNPDQHARSMTLAKESGVPVDVVNGEIDEWQNDSDLSKYDFSSITQNNPATARYLSITDNAIIAQDDIDALTSLEDLIKPIEAGAAGLVSGSYGVLESGMRVPDAAHRWVRGLNTAAEDLTGLPESLNPMRAVEYTLDFFASGKIPGTSIQKGGMTDIAGSIDDTQKILADNFDPFKVNVEASMKADLAMEKAVQGDFSDVGKILTDPEAIAGFIGQAIPSLALVYLSGGNLPFIALLESMEVASSAADFEERTGEKISDVDFMQAQTQVALFNSVLEKIVPDALLSGAAGKSAISIFTTGMKELTTESVQAFNINLAEKLAFNEDKKLTDGIIQGAIGGGALGVGTSTAQYAANRFKVTQEVSKVEQLKLDQINEIVKTLKLKTRGDAGKGSLREFVTEVSGDNDQSIFIDGAQAALYLQTKTEDEIQSDQALLLIDAHVREAASLGNDVQIPMNDFIVEIAGTEHFNQLKDSMTITTETVPKFNETQNNEDNRAFIENIMNEAKSNATDYIEAQEVYQTARSQLIDSGSYKPKYASVMAKVVPAWVTVRAQSTGQTIKEVYADAGLVIKGPLTGERSRVGGSTTQDDGSTTQDDDPNIYNQFAGMNAKTAVESDLYEAIRLENKGLGQSAIKAQTGWFKGVDDNWRFEISDDKARLVKARDNVDLDEVMKHLTFKEVPNEYYGTVFDVIYKEGTRDHLSTGGKTKDEALSAIVNALARRYGGNYDDKIKDGKSTKLSDILHHPELFDAYPDLADTSVTQIIGEQFTGSFVETRDEIGLNLDRTDDEVLSTLLHEIQHAIQYREGFAVGGNDDAAFSYNVKRVIESMSHITKGQLSRWIESNSEGIQSEYATSETLKNALIFQSSERLIDYANRDRPSSVFRLIRNEAQWIYHEAFRGNDEASELQRRFFEIPSRGTKRNEFLKDFALDLGKFLRESLPAGQLDKFRSDTRQLNSMVKSFEREYEKAHAANEPMRELERSVKVTDELHVTTLAKTPYQIYRSLAGEIEARTTQARQKLTDEQRRTRPVSLDMDIHASEAIVIIGGMEIALPVEVHSQDEARGYYDPANTIIRMTESANLSTFLHEFAHFMYDMELKSSTESLDGINKWFKRDMKDVMNESGQSEDDINLYIDEGTTGDTDKDSVIQRTLHERFARAFELYLMEGKAPSVELRNAFRSYARWLSRIYQSIKGELNVNIKGELNVNIKDELNVNIDDEMRSVFDRMLATEDQIASAEARAKVEPFFTSVDVIDEDDRAAYRAQQEVVKGQQSETLRDKIISQLTRQKATWWKTERQDMIDEVMTELKSEKVNIARTRLKSKSVEQPSLAMKLDHAVVMELLGEERVDSRGKKSTIIPAALVGMTAEGGAGLHPDEAAAFLGYKSGSELLHDLVNAPKMSDEAKRLAELRMKDVHGDIMTDGTIEREADEAVQNEERGKLILLELKILSKKTRTPSLERQAVKDMAVERISKLSFHETHPGKYRRAEIRAAQEATRLHIEGDTHGAIQAKQRQIVNYYLGLSAVEAKNGAVKTVSDIARYNKKKVRESIMKSQGGHWEQIAGILSRFEFRKSKSLKSVDNINVWLTERNETEGESLVLSNVVLNDSYVTHWKNVSFSDLQGIRDSVRNIEHVARYIDEITIAGEKMTFNKLKSDWVNHIHKQKVRFDTKSTRSRIHDSKEPPVSDHVRKWASQLTKVPYLTSWLDGGERAGFSNDILVQPFTDALDLKMTLVDEVVAPIITAIKSRTLEDIKRHKKKIWIPEIDDYLEGHQVLAVALNVGNQGNLRKLLLGEGWANPDDDSSITIYNPQLQAVLSYMSRSDWELVQLIWNQMNKLYPMLADVHQRTTGLVPPKVDATPVITKYGTYPGGFYPVKYSSSRSHRAARNAEKLLAETTSMFNNTASIQSSVNASSTSERTGFYDRIHLSLEVVPDHFNETIHYITHHDAVRQVNRLLQSPEIADAITSVLGEHEFNQLKPWLNDIAKDGRQQPTKTFIDTTFQRLRFGVTLGAMGFKASTGIMQVFGLLTTSAEVGLSQTTKAMITTVGRSWYMNSVRRILGSREDMQTSWDFASERSKVMNHRMSTFDREIRNAMERLKGESGLLPAIQEMSMKHIALIQTYIVDLPTWHAAYDKELSESNDEAKAIRVADWSVENLQGSGATKDMATILRNQSKIHTTFTMFMTYFSALGNLSRDLVKGAKTRQYSVTSVGAKLMFLYSIPVFLEMLMRGDMDEPDDEDERLSKYLTGVALYPVVSIPFVRDVASGLIGDYGYNVSPVASVLEQGIAGYKQIGKGILTDDEITKSAVKNATKLTGAALGLPGINQVWATGEHLYEVIEDGEEATTREIIFGPDRD